MTETVKKSLLKLGEKKTPKKPLPALSPAPAIGASTGFAKPQAKVAPAGAISGIASPLKEPDVGRRVYYPDQEVVDANGNPYIVNHIKRIYLQDAAGNPFVISDFGLPDPNSITIEP